MAGADDGNSLGFMGGVLGMSKKVLFPAEEMSSSPEEADASSGGGGGGGGAGFAIVAASSSSSSTTTTTGGKRRSKTRRARRAKLAASKSSLADFASYAPIVVAERGGPASGVGKENAKPTKESLAKRGGGGSPTMESLAVSLADVSMMARRRDGGGDAAGAGRRMGRSSMEGGGVDVPLHRRRSRNDPRRAEDSSLYSCGEPPSVGGGRISKPEKSIRRRMKNYARRESKERVESNFSIDGTTYSIAEIDNSLVGGKMNMGENRGRGRRNHPVSSLVQTEGTEEKCKRNSGLSSLMTLTSSIQKTQKSRRSKRDKWKANHRAIPSHSSGRASIPSDNRENVASIANCVESLTIGDMAECSTPLTIRHRALPGGITSPPVFLHRFSTLSNANIFDRSPMPDSNPNLKKRFDGKKTPSSKKMPVRPPAATSPSPLSMVTKMSTSPYVFEDAGEEKSACARINKARDSTGRAASSPRVLVLSSSSISSPTNECNALSHARSKLFSSNGDTLEAEVLRPGSDVTLEVATPRPKKHDFIVRTTPSASPKGPVRGSAVFDVEVVVPVMRKESDAFVAPRRKFQTKEAANEDKSTKTAVNKKVSVRPRVATKVVKDDQVTEVRRSSRQSKPTDRLTVTSWVNEDNINTDEKVRFNNSVDAYGSGCEVIEEAVNHPPSVEKQCIAVEQADATKQVKDSDDASKLNSERSVSNNITVQARKSTADGSAADQEWSHDDLQILRHCQKEINPTSTLYWQEVATRVGTKTSSECQVKWQSLVLTPKVRKAPKSARNPHHHSEGGVVDASILDDDEDEDDLFNSSPYRDEDGKETNGRMFTSFGTSHGLTPCIKQSTIFNEPSALKFRRKGYNTYIGKTRKMTCLGCM